MASPLRLIFDIEAEGEDGQVQHQGERMWVTVAERIGDCYIGILENQPACLQPGENVYLCMGTEVPFLAEHVVDIANPRLNLSSGSLGKHQNVVGQGIEVGGRTNRCS